VQKLQGKLQKQQTAERKQQQHGVMPQGHHGDEEDKVGLEGGLAAYPGGRLGLGGAR
jgi:hypothetical protein